VPSASELLHQRPSQFGCGAAPEPPDAALAGQSAAVSDDAATGAADFKGLGLMEMGLNYLGEAAESHACDGPVEPSAWRLRDGIGRGEGFVECLCRVNRLGQRDQAGESHRATSSGLPPTA
jgi:hypothetical protein